MKPLFRQRDWVNRLLATGLLAALAAGGTGIALANTEVVTLERLKVHDVILLPTVSSQYEAQFTKPATWQVAPSSALYLEFQHSSELLPNRSWLQIIVNDQVIKHIPLTHENIEGTKLTIPLPVGLLKDFNRLDFRVQQHYTDHCEDPLDKSLWTQILPATKIVFNYTPVVPKVDLAAYPYPIIDTLTYSPAKVRFITGKGATEKELQALAYLNVHLAQQAQEHELISRAAFRAGHGPDDENVVLVGKPDSIPEAASYQGAFGAYALQGGQWINRSTNQPLSGEQGVVLFFQAPGSKQHTVLIVSGNTDDAVLKAAKYLTTRPIERSLTGSAQTVPAEWNEPGTNSGKPPRYIENQTRTFQELGFANEEVHKINAPPITYKLPVVSKFRNSGGKLWLDLVYSYSPQLNPEFSSLELRMNDISIANVPLTNPAGEQLARFSAPISSELVRPRNELVAQFHLMPDKYGWCVDNYVDNAWGKIMDNSQVRVEGGPGSYLPDVGLLNNKMFPYSREDNLSGVQIALPAEPSESLLNAMLGFTTRLGRATLAETDLRLSLAKGGSLDTGKNVAVFHTVGDGLKLPDGARLIWQAGNGLLMKLLTLSDPDKGKLIHESSENGGGAYMEQYATAGDRVVTVFTASQSQGFLTLGKLLENDKQFEALSQGFLQQASLLNPQVNTVTDTAYHLETHRNTVNGGNWWSQLTGWAKTLPWMNVIFGLVGVFLVLLLLPLLFRRR